MIICLENGEGMLIVEAFERIEEWRELFLMRRVNLGLDVCLWVCAIALVCSYSGGVSSHQKYRRYFNNISSLN